MTTNGQTGPAKPALDAFFANYVAINTLHQFAIQGLATKAFFEWPPRFGSGHSS